MPSEKTCLPPSSAIPERSAPSSFTFINDTLLGSATASPSAGTAVSAVMSGGAFNFKFRACSFVSFMKVKPIGPKDFRVPICGLIQLVPSMPE